MLSIPEDKGKGALSSWGDSPEPDTHLYGKGCGITHTHTWVLFLCAPECIIPQCVRGARQPAWL